MSRLAWLNPGDPPDAFPPVDDALREPDGLLAAGGDLSVERLVYAYRNGIFPWYDEGQPLLWWSPDPRCVMQPGDFHLSRRSRRYLKASQATIRFNSAFDDVIRACAAPRPTQRDTWITPDMIRAYEHLHREGWAHSIEVWLDGELAGGLYGLAIGRAFFGESMFSAAPNASKAALLTLATLMDRQIFGIVDCQVLSSHLLSLGARMLPRSRFIDAVELLCEPASRFENWPNDPIPVAELLQ